MAVRYQVAAILFLVLLNYVSSSCDVDDVAVYKVTLQMLWSEERFPKDYPLNRPKAQWSQTFGQSHNNSYVLYRLGEVSKPSVRQFAQYGTLDDLVGEGDDEPKVYDQFSSPAVGSGVGKTENMVLLDGGHSLVSLMCRLIPSPDWFVGVDSLNLCVDSSWVDQITLDLEPLDAGAANGLTFTAPRWESSPPDPVTRHKPRSPAHPAAGFYYPELKELPAIAQVGFTKVKEYSTIELNNLARKELLTILKKKDLHKGTPKTKTESARDDNDYTTKSHLDQLKDLEEDPVGTPRPNVPDNRVDVITSTPSRSSTDREFDKELTNMDDVVLAVAHGRKLGLGKRLPRHFRHRLHHAVNRIQPDDCLVSDWTEWSQCSSTCGFGEQFRYRHIVREKSDEGRKCPKLTDRRHCGKANSCMHIEYFDW